MKEIDPNNEPIQLEAILLDISKSDKTLTLRIDCQGFLANQNGGLPIRILTLRGCDIESTFLADLTNGIDQSVYYDIDSNRKSIDFVINYIDTPVTLSYVEIAEQEEDYSYADLMQKSARLARLCIAYQEENWHLRDEHYRFSERLQKLIEREVDIAARKVEFFKQRNPEKTANIIGKLDALNKVLGSIKDLATNYSLTTKN